MKSLLPLQSPQAFCSAAQSAEDSEPGTHLSGELATHTFPAGHWKICDESGLPLWQMRNELSVRHAIPLTLQVLHLADAGEYKRNVARRQLCGEKN